MSRRNAPVLCPARTVIARAVAGYEGDLALARAAAAEMEATLAQREQALGAMRAEIEQARAAAAQQAERLAAMHW